jgi:hypothetical protein
VSRCVRTTAAILPHYAPSADQPPPPHTYKDRSAKLPAFAHGRRASPIGRFGWRCEIGFALAEAGPAMPWVSMMLRWMTEDLSARTSRARSAVATTAQLTWWA